MERKHFVERKSSLERLYLLKKGEQEGAKIHREWEAGSTLIKASELEYRKDDEIARGNYGTVYKGRCRGFPVAIKLLHNQQLTQHKIEELKREVEIMKALRHPCILLLMGVCTEKDNLAVVMEYVEGRDLGTIVHDLSVDISTKQKLHIAKGVAQGMNWLHCLKPEPIIHRDLKPANILVTKEGNVKVCDFGLSCVKERFDPKAPPKDKAVGTPVYMAPEILCGVPSSEKSDVYAYAILLWELFNRKGRPFQSIPTFDAFCDAVIDRHERPLFTEDVPGNIQKLIQDCWHPDRHFRPSFSEILDRLDDIVVDNVVKDRDGRSLYKRLRRKESTAHYPWVVDWDNFVLAFCQYYSTDATTLGPETTLYKCAKLALAEEDKDQTAGDSNRKFVVTCESFARFLKVFGPLRETILAEFDEICKRGCWHGMIEAKEAERRLAALKKGYLLRLSSKDNCITISRKVNGTFQHQRVLRKDDGYNVQIGKEIYCFATVLDFLDSPQARERSKKGGLHLKKICSKDSEYAKVHKHQTTEESSYIDATDLEDQLTKLLGSRGANSPHEDL
jgi:serine/threonine protein kinase